MTTDRVTRGLAWLGIALLILGAVVTLGAIALTTSIEALVTAASVAALALALPGAAAFGMGLWLEHAAERAEQRAIAALQPPSVPETSWGETLGKYALAIVAVLCAWGMRAWLDVYIPNEVPFVTFFLAVAFAGWVGGFGPSVAATLLSTAIAGVMYVRPESNWDAGRIMLLAIFLVVSLGIAAIVSALHDALGRAQHVTADARRSEAVRDTENPLRALAQFAPAALFMTDAAQGCTYCNRSWLAFRGRALQQELGNGWLEGVHAEDLARRREAFAEALATREPRSVTYRLKHADGGFRPVRDVVVAHVNARGQVVGLFGTSAELAAGHPEPEQDAKALADPTV